MSDNDWRDVSYWVHQIWHSLQALVSSAGNSVNSNIATIGNQPATLPLSVSVDALGNQAADVFGRLVVAEQFTIFDSKQIADKQPLFWDDAATSGAGTTTTFNTNQASTSIGVTNLTAGTRVRQTYQRMNYQPGKGQVFLLTATMGARATGITRRWGAFDASNGLFFEQTSAGVRFGVRTFTGGSAATTYTAYLNLALPNGVTIDETKGNIWFIAYEWLGVGDVVFGAYYGQRPQVLGVVENTNNQNAVYISTPNLPVRYEIANSGAGPTATLTHICTTVISSGGRQQNGTVFAVDRATTALTTLNDADIYPLIAIRLRSGYEGAEVSLATAHVMCTSTAQYRWSLLLNPTVTGTAFSFTAVTNSAIEADVARTSGTKVSGGTQLGSGYGQQSSTESAVISVEIPNRIRLGSSIAGVNDVIVLAAQRITGTTESFYGALSWRENV